MKNDLIVTPVVQTLHYSKSNNYLCVHQMAASTHGTGGSLQSSLVAMEPSTLLQLGIIHLFSSGMMKTALRMQRRDAFISELRFIAHYRESQQTPLNKLGNQLSGGFCTMSALHIFTNYIYHILLRNCYCLFHTLRIKY